MPTYKFNVGLLMYSSSNMSKYRGDGAWIIVLSVQCTNMDTSELMYKGGVMFYVVWYAVRCEVWFLVWYDVWCF